MEESSGEPVLCPACVSGHIHTGTPEGTIQQVGKVEAYVANPADESRKKIIIFLTDVFGHKFVNSQLLADEFAKNGFCVYIPDLFNGGAIDINVMHRVENGGFFAKVSGMLSFLPFMWSHRQVITRPIIDGFIEEIRSQNPSSKIGVAGYCFGGFYSMIAASNPLVDATVTCHPGGGDLTGVIKPSAVYYAPNDFMFNEKTANKIKASLEEKNDVPFEIIGFPGQKHGWAVRANIANEIEKQGKEKVTVDTINFFNKYLQ